MSAVDRARLQAIVKSAPTTPPPLPERPTPTAEQKAARVAQLKKIAARADST